MDQRWCEMHGMCIGRWRASRRNVLCVKINWSLLPAFHSLPLSLPTCSSLSSHIFLSIIIIVAIKNCIQSSQFPFRPQFIFQVIHSFMHRPLSSSFASCQVNWVSKHHPHLYRKECLAIDKSSEVRKEGKREGKKEGRKTTSLSTFTIITIRRRFKWRFQEKRVKYFQETRIRYIQERIIRYIQKRIIRYTCELYQVAISIGTSDDDSMSYELALVSH